MTSEQIYRILLKAYPAGYRREYEEAMTQCFRDQLRAADTTGKRARLWLRAIADFALTIPARYWECVRPRRGNSPFSDGARHALFFARFEASSFSRTEISLEHLLLGALRNDRDLAATLLGPDGLKGIVGAIEIHETNPRRLPPQEDLPLSQECRAAVARAWDDARAAGAKISPRDLLAAILQQDTSLAARLLRERSLDLSGL